MQRALSCFVDDSHSAATDFADDVKVAECLGNRTDWLFPESATEPLVFVRTQLFDHLDRREQVANLVRDFGMFGCVRRD